MKKLVKKFGTAHWTYIAEQLRCEMAKLSAPLASDDARCLLKCSCVKAQRILDGHPSTPLKNSKQCRERWFNQIDPRLYKAPFSQVENFWIVQFQKKYGEYITL